MTTITSANVEISKTGTTCNYTKENLLGQGPRGGKSKTAKDRRKKKLAKASRRRNRQP